MKHAETKGIYLRGSTYWLQPPMQHGVRPKPVTLQTPDLAKAIARAKEIREIGELSASDTVMSEVKHFIAYQTAPQRRIYSRNSAAASFSTLRVFHRGLPKTRKLSTITTADVQRFYDEQLKTVSHSSAWRYLGWVKAFFKWAETNKLVRRDVTAEVDAAKPKFATRLLYCTRDQRDMLIRECQCPTMKMILMLGFFCGMRKNEICEAVPEWFNLDLKLVDMRDTPTLIFNEFKRARTVPMREELRDYLREYGLRSPYLIRPDVKHGKGIYRYGFHYPFELYVASKGLAWCTPHVMRHTFASLLLIDGRSLFKVAKWMGDSTEVVEKHYGHLCPMDDEIEDRIPVKEG